MGRAKLLFGAVCAALLCLLLLGIGAARTQTADAATAGEYGFRIKRFQVEMAVSADRTVETTETITVGFTGYSAHGIIRDFPLDSGVRYEGIRAECSSDDFSPYVQTDDASFLSLYLRGEGLVRGQEIVYTISYTMYLPAIEGAEGYLPLDVIGYGWATEIEDVSVRVTVPEGLKDYAVLSGSAGAKGNEENVQASREGDLLLLTVPRLSSRSMSAGITLELQFVDGVLTEATDFPLLYALLAGGLLIGLALLVKVVFFRRPLMTETVNLTAPEEMDPLLMGKLIDNKVDAEDLGSLVYYLAEHGYLTIDMSEDADDPLLKATEKMPPIDAPEYLKVYYEGLFRGRDHVRASQLNAAFYETAKSVVAGVSLRSGKMYRTSCNVATVLFGVLSVLVLGGFAFLYNLLSVFKGYYYWIGFPVCLIAYLLACAGSRTAKQREKKWKKPTTVLYPLLLFAISLLPAFAFTIFGCAGFGALTGWILTLSASVTGLIGGLFLTRTEEYSARLGHILGFRRFIVVTEKDRIEFMLKEDPGLYYHILPYAQVLGVTDVWTEKFAGLSLQPPAYLAANSYNMFDAIFYCNLFRRTSLHFSHCMTSRPASSGGGFGGSFGGGFGGGGFGGGGGRGC